MKDFFLSFLHLILMMRGPVNKLVLRIRIDHFQKTIQKVLNNNRSTHTICEQIIELFSYDLEPVKINRNKAIATMLASAISECP